MKLNKDILLVSGTSFLGLLFVATVALLIHGTNGQSGTTIERHIALRTDGRWGIEETMKQACGSNTSGDLITWFVNTRKFGPIEISTVTESVYAHKH
jgi:hypothetical protein